MNKFKKGDRVKIPTTKCGKPAFCVTIRHARENNQNYVIINCVPGDPDDKGDEYKHYVVWWKSDCEKGDFFDEEDLDYYRPIINYLFLLNNQYKLISDVYYAYNRKQLDSILPDKIIIGLFENIETKERMCIRSDMEFAESANSSPEQYKECYILGTVVNDNDFNQFLKKINKENEI